MKITSSLRTAFLFAVSFVLFISCKTDELPAIVVEEPVSQDISMDIVITEMGTPVIGSSLESGHMRVQISDDLLATLTESQKRSGEISLSKIKSAKALSEDMGIYKIERTFPYAREFEARTHAAGLDKWYDIYYDESFSMTRAYQELRQVSDFTFVEYRPKVQKLFDEEVIPDLGPVRSATSSIADLFNDPGAARQWHYFNDGSSTNMVAGSDINVLPVWQSITTGNPNVVVAVVDGGIDYSHEDLASNMWKDPNNGYRSYGYNFVNNTYAVSADDHGTHVAGTIAAVNNNGVGVCGIAGGNYAAGQSGVKLMSCQIFTDDDSGSGSAAIKWAADHGAVIAQNSWGYDGITYVPYSDRAAIDYFNTYAGFDANGNQVGPMAGGVVLFSAGNEDTDHGYPAEYEGCISVASIGPDFKRAYYSCYGDWVDVCTPGGDYKKGKQVYSTLPGNNYGNMQGTSMACPHASGVAALIVSKYGGPGFTRDMLWNRLVNTATDISKYNNKAYPIGKLVNALAALSNMGTIAPDPISDFSATPLNSNFVQIDITVPADQDDDKAFGVNVYYDKEPITSISGVQYKSFNFGGLEVGKTFTETLSGLDFNTKYYLRCVSFDIAGNRSSLSKEITVTTSKNNPPVISVPSVLKFDVKAHETKYIPFTYTDEDGHAMSPDLVSTSGADSLYILGKQKSQIAIFGSKGTPGTYTSTVYVYDEYNAYSSFSYTYTLHSNHAPAKIKDVDNILLGKIGETQQLPLTDYIVDEDGEVLSFIIDIDTPSVANVTVANNIIYVTGLSNGTTFVHLKASDSLGESVETTFYVLVRGSGLDYDVYPNPVSTNLMIRTGTVEETVDVKIVSSNGGVVHESSTTASAFNPVVINMTNVPVGNYTVYFSFGGKQYKTTIAKI